MVGGEWNMNGIADLRSCTMPQCRMAKNAKSEWESFTLLEEKVTDFSPFEIYLDGSPESE